MFDQYVDAAESREGLSGEALRVLLPGDVAFDPQGLRAAGFDLFDGGLRVGDVRDDDARAFLGRPPDSPPGRCPSHPP